MAIDLGAESGRAILGKFDGQRLQLTDVHRFSNTPVRLPDGLHWNVLRLLTEIKEGIGLAVHNQGVQLASIGLDTWGVDFGLLDRGGALLSNPYHYRDNRTDGIFEIAFQRMPREQIFELTGIQFMPINSVFQLLSMVVSKSPMLEVAGTFLTMPDLFNYWLTGEKACEFSIATTTQCYDPRQRAWSDPLLAAMSLPRHIFPPIIQPGTVVGPLLNSIAEETGARNTPVIAPACHDTGSAVAAVPAAGQNFAWISSGTWSIMGIESPEAIITPSSLKFNFTNEGGVKGTFRFCKNIAGLWLVQECRRTWAAQGQEHSYAALTQMAAQATPFVSLIDPDYAEFAKPGDMPSRIRAYCKRTGQPEPESKAAIVRCILESLALKYRLVLEHLENMVGGRLAPIHMVGGGTKNRTLSQFTADATNRQVITGPVEATAIGNILMQAIALKDINSLAEGRQVVTRSFELEPFEPHDRDMWDEVYPRFIELAE
jgi:sugar (pentulose or hexulose) kinase